MSESHDSQIHDANVSPADSQGHDPAAAMNIRLELQGPQEEYEESVDESDDGFGSTDRATDEEEDEEMEEDTKLDDTKHEDSMKLEDLRISPPYSVAEVASELLSLYQVMTRMYLPDDIILQPPEGGWPHITEQAYANLNKSPAAIELLRHIPYLKCGRSHSDAPYIYPECSCVDYAGEYMHDCVINNQVSLCPAEEKPPHVVILGSMVGRNGFQITFDTRTGQLRREDWMWGNRRKFHDIKHFCTVSKQEFEQMRIIPFSDKDLKFGPKHPGERPQDERAEIYDLYHQFGWPGDGYRKAECLVELEEARQRFWDKICS